MNNLRNITLEMSLKPFKEITDNAIEEVCRKAFSQWNNLLIHSDMISIMLWSSDGSEILDYKARLEDEFEWARYIGGANPRQEWNKKVDPDGIGLHTKCYLYMENPPIMTYGILKKIIEILKRVGQEVTGKYIRVGATFDPGPEFAKSEFKYKKHEEILLGDTMGKKSFVCCYSVLHADQCHYAAYPDGIPEETSFGTFFGKQCQCFLTDMGFDYLWLSNGFGFGTETWGTTGAIFDGENFYVEKMAETQQKIHEFWKLFRKECPDFRIETRGTNLSAGIDLASDGVNLKDIYSGNYNILPPPNSPWAALDGDFGLELTGYMSRISEIPEEDFLFRFYVHDPWWMNSPWLDRYEGYPHDIYLPLAISRINEKGEIKNPNYLNLLTIDNSLGDMPEQCPNEIIPHLLKAYDHQPDAAAPFIWVYPFKEYHEIASLKEGKVKKPFFEDWYIRGAINNGFPVSTVVSTDNFLSSMENKPDMYMGTVIVTPIPEKESLLEERIIHIIKNGGKVVFYGSVERCGNNLLKLLNLTRTTSIEGNLKLKLKLITDEVADNTYSNEFYHNSLLSDGGIDTLIDVKEDAYTKVLAEVQKKDVIRVAALCRNCPQWEGGSVLWLRGTSSNYFSKDAHLLVPHSPAEYYPMEMLMRMVLQEIGFHISFIKNDPSVKSPVIMLHRKNNAFYFSGYVPDTTVKIKMKFPIGAPLLIGGETRLHKGFSEYFMQRAWHSECRAFVDQEEDATISCKECISVSFYMKRRLLIAGLKNATIRVFPEKGYEENTELLLNSSYPYLVGEAMKIKRKNTPWGVVLEVVNITGSLIISMPF
jgi:hypothetical protein